MARTTQFKNGSQNAAKAAKADEFYTQWADIEREVNAYLEFDPDVFRDKVILLPCDDPEWSNFAKFFALHFVDYGIKKLMSTSYAPDSNPAGQYYEPTLDSESLQEELQGRPRQVGVSATCTGCWNDRFRLRNRCLVGALRPAWEAVCGADTSPSWPQRSRVRELHRLGTYRLEHGFSGLTCSRTRGTWPFGGLVGGR